MAKRPAPKKPKKNEFCGETGCKLKFVHWHDKIGAVHVPYTGEPKTTGVKANAVIVDDPHEPAEEPIEADAPPEDALTAKIREGLLKIPNSDDPHAARFQGKSPEEARIIVVGERIAKMADQNDLALSTLLQKVGDVQKSAADTEKTVSAYAQRQDSDGAKTKLLIETKLIPEYDNFKGAVVERYNLQNKRMQELIVGVHALESKFHRLPGFWTVTVAAMAGGAALLVFIGLVITAAYFFMR